MEIQTMDLSKFKSLEKLRKQTKEKKDNEFFPNLPEYMRNVLRESYDRYYQVLNCYENHKR